MLIFLVILFLAFLIATGMVLVVANIHASGEVFVLSEIRQCSLIIDTDDTRLNDETWISTIVWETLALSFAFWIVIKHFCELRQLPTGPAIGDCHVLYFAG
ncbi:hypothetical protein DFH29DRAFT_643030 [Suillus ampliporus]|nr:hypothetical protein DFH29DRAFT_643030 [Suillus ampliporus]